MGPDSPPELAPTLLHEFFERVALRLPDACAVDVPPGTGRPDRRRTTYAELDRLSNTVGHHLRAFASENSCVAILLNRDSETLYAAQLGVLKAGAAYLCLDPAFPEEQIRHILSDSGAVALLTDAAGVERAKRAKYAVARLIDAAELLSQPFAESAPLPPAEWLAPSSLAYSIYTSGTTGRPKGVLISHESIANLVRSDITEFGLTPDDRVAQNSSPAYDSSLEEIWLALAVGAALVPMDDDTVRLGPDLVPWLQREQVTVFCPPPTLLRTTGCHNPQAALPDLRLVYVGGEALTHDIADLWAPGRRLENGYGPTECTVTATRTRIQPGDDISIGKPIPGIQAWVLDESLNEVPDGEHGELCLGGIGLAAGYRNRPDLTAERFPVHPTLGRIYRSGDLVHRGPNGDIYYHSRIDSQVKLRGYRIELEAIEACLARCIGVLEAAVRVQEEGGQQFLSAYVVAADNASLPPFADLKDTLAKELPAYMMPARFGSVHELPKSIGGKLKRSDLPDLPAPSASEDRQVVRPRNEAEARLADAFATVLDIPGGVSVEDDFFKDLGGSSLSAAMVVSLLRGSPETASITVRDLYEARTVRELAVRVQPVTADATAEGVRDRTGGRPVAATVLQAAWLIAELLIGTPIAYALFFIVLPWAIGGLGLIPTILLGPAFALAGFVLYAPLSVLFAVAVKKALIGRYWACTAPVWGSLYVRNWMVQQAVRTVPWGMLAGTEFQCMALRALGARIGQRVHIHRGVDLQKGGWDLLEIGDEVTIAQEAAIRLVDLEDGHIVVGPVTLGDRCTLDIRSGVGPNTVVEEEGYLTELSSLPEGGRIPRGERWMGIPAKPDGTSPVAPAVPPGRTLPPVAHGVALILAEFLLLAFLALPVELLGVGLILAFGKSPDAMWDFVTTASLGPRLVLAVIGMVVVPLPFTVALEALAARILGRVPEGVISVWSPAYIRVWLKARLVDSANEWLSGAMFWPIWLRAAGMKVGRGCEISTIIDVVPELVEIGPETFFADGIYLGGPRIHRGTVTLARTVLRKGTFVGNHAVIPSGQDLPADILLGVCTVADDQTIRPGTSWFGLPPFELPQREIVECDRSLTYQPSAIRYVNRLAWETLRFALPILPAFVLLFWIRAMDEFALSEPLPRFLLTTAPLLTFAAGAIMCFSVLALKWLLLGRVKPGTHPLWSCWCSRWDLLYVAWSLYARGALVSLEGTLLLNVFLRLVGMRIGKRVVLGSGFAQVVDPDMLEIQDDATVHAMFQAHTFEDRVLKIDRVVVRRGATVGCATVPLYGADIGGNTHVAAHSVVMKRERLLPGIRYEGAPTRPAPAEPVALKPREPARGAVHIWYLRTADLDSHQFAECRKILSKDELRKADEHKAPGERDARVAAWALARRSLSKVLDVPPSEWEFAADADGKPRITRPESGRALHFNLSHTDGLVVCAISTDGEIGVDAERILNTGQTMPDVDGLLQSDEMNALSKLSPQEQNATLCRAWTAKEAVSKCIGPAMRLNPESIRRLSNGGSSERWEVGEEPTTVSVIRTTHPAVSPEHSVCVAIADSEGSDDRLSRVSVTDGLELIRSLG